MALRQFASAAYIDALIFGPTSLKSSFIYLDIAKTYLIGQKPADLSHVDYYSRLSHVCP